MGFHYYGNDLSVHPKLRHDFCAPTLQGWERERLFTPLVWRYIPNQNSNLTFDDHNLQFNTNLAIQCCSFVILDSSFTIRHVCQRCNIQVWLFEIPLAMYYHCRHATFHFCNATFNFRHWISTPNDWVRFNKQAAQTFSAGSSQNQRTVAVAYIIIYQTLNSRPVNCIKRLER